MHICQRISLAYLLFLPIGYFEHRHESLLNVVLLMKKKMFKATYICTYMHGFTIILHLSRFYVKF